MDANINEIEVNGVVYVRKSNAGIMAKQHEGLDYCIVRTIHAGVFAGYCDCKGDEATVYNARRIWYWRGAATLSQLAKYGTSDPDNCKFPEAVQQISLTGVIEVLFCTDVAQKSIEGVKIWSA